MAEGPAGGSPRFLLLLSFSVTSSKWEFVLVEATGEGAVSLLPEAAGLVPKAGAVVQSSSLERLLSALGMLGSGAQR